MIDDRSVSDLEREVDLASLKDSGWFPDSVEVCSGAAAGSGSTAFLMRTPLSELLAKEPLGEGDELLLEQRAQWITDGAMLIIREAIGTAKRPDPVDVGLTILTWAWDMQLPPLNTMSQGDLAELAAQGRAAICERHKVKAESKKVAAGMKATKMQRQKPNRMVRIYAERARGNKNRRSGSMREKLLACG
jgi:hypothetical protein